MLAFATLGLAGGACAQSTGAGASTAVPNKDSRITCNRLEQKAKNGQELNGSEQLEYLSCGPPDPGQNSWGNEALTPKITSPALFQNYPS